MRNLVEAEVLWGVATAAEISEADLRVTKLVCRKQAFLVQGHRVFPATSGLL